MITARKGIISSGVITATAADIDDFLDVGSNIQLGNAGVITATTFKGDGDFVELDVDGHTNLDNVSISGVTTGTTINATTFVGDGDFVELDVDGHTNLDNVSIAGVTTTSGLLDVNGLIEATAGQNKIPFLYGAMADLPSAGSYHGMFAHVHATGRGYFAHGGGWYELVNKESNLSLIHI